MWIARDKDGTLHLFDTKPFKLSEDARVWIQNDRTLYDNFMELDSSLFPELIWESEPMKVELKHFQYIRESVIDFVYSRFSVRTNEDGTEEIVFKSNTLEGQSKHLDEVIKELFKIFNNNN